MPIITPEQQIANIRASLDYLKRTKRHRGRKWAITAALQQLAETEAQFAAGTLRPLIVADGAPF